MSKMFKYPIGLNMKMLNKYCVTPKANPLLEDIQFVQARIAQLKQRTKRFYFSVLLGKYNCPKCSGGLTMTDKSQCLCSCGNIFDPTLAFQKSTCCGTQLVRRTFHYVCSRCKKVSPSRFIFDERIFDREYFSRMMQASRAKARKKKQEMIKFLTEVRSGELPLLQEPCLESIPGLISDLDHFVSADDADDTEFAVDSGFAMEDYRRHILSALGYGSRMFSGINCVSQDPREDRVWRFVTLIFMQHDQEIELTQYDNDLLIESAEG
jgi:hypothetical protein